MPWLLSGRVSLSLAGGVLAMASMNCSGVSPVPAESAGGALKGDLPPAPCGFGSKVSRAFHFEYAATISGLSREAKQVRVWVPLPRSDEAQVVSNLKVEVPAPYRESHDPHYHNRMAYFELAAPLPEKVPITVSFDVVRWEARSLRADVSPELRRRLLEGDRLVPLNPEVRSRAARAVAGKDGVEARAHGIFQRVLRDVDYDKSGEGWGRGDVVYVCLAGKGNCSDFHALFTGMARCQGIPAIFEVGFPLPLGATEGTVAGYHCWAWFEAGGGLWTPVDASEADKNPEQAEFFFGTLCSSRVAFTRGRDVHLEPRQAGEPLNFFIYPYFEVDGKPEAGKLEKRFTFCDTPSL